MTEWMRCYWDEEDVWFLFEVGSDGWVSRQIELQGESPVPIPAASLSEWYAARDAGRLAAYEAVFGMTAQLPVSAWEGHDPIPMSAAEFEEAWRSARRVLEDRAS